MADQNTDGTPPNPNMGKAKKAGGIMLTILNFLVKWLIMKPLKLMSKQAHQLMKELLEYKSILIKRVLSSFLLLFFIFNPLYLIFSGSWVHYTSMTAYLWEVIFAGHWTAFSISVFVLLIASAAWILKGMTNSAVRSFGMFTSVMALVIPSAICSILYFGIPFLQSFSAIALFWVAEFIAAFFLGAGMASSKIKIKSDGSRDSNSTIVEDHTDDDGNNEE